MDNKIKIKGDLTRLTLVVPTYKRQQFALRLMDYWDDKGPDVIILDGSSEPIAADLLKKYAPKIRYFHKPVGFYERLSSSLDLISTDFVALAGDDEFYMPSAVARCIDELDRQSDLVACCGRAIGFSYRSDFVRGMPQYSALENYSIDAASSDERLVKHMREYVPSLIYAVCRTNAWKTSFKYTLEEEFPFFAAGEFQFEMFMSYAGRSKVTPELMWLRSYGETEPTRGTDPSLVPAKRIPDWWRNPNNSFQHEKFFTIMAEGFSKLSDEAKETNEYRNSVVKGVEAYLEYYNEHLRHNRVRRYIRGIAIRLIPEVFLKPLKSLLQKLRPNKSNAGTELMTTTELITAAESLEASGVIVDFDELKNIESVIREFHQSL